MNAIKEVCPDHADYALQAHQIGRAAYSMPIMARRLVYLAMAQVRPGDTELPPLRMAVGDIVRALDLNDGALSYDRIRDAAKTAAGQIVELEWLDGSWQLFGWLSECRYEAAYDTIVIQLAQALKPYILGLQRAYARLSIADIARIQGRHALRWYELVMSREGQADKQGRWWYEVSVAELRRLLRIAPGEYRQTAQLRIRVIDEPLEELNAAGLGIHLRAEYIRKGRVLEAVRVHAQRVGRGDPKPVDPPTPEEAADDALIARHQARYDAILAEIQAQPALPGMDWTPDLRALAQRREALTRLKAEVPRRGRPPKEAPK